MEKIMLRKIAVGTLFIGLIGILVAGAVIRTMDRTGRVAEARDYGYYGCDHDKAGECAEGESGQGRGRSYGRGRYGGRGREDAFAINSTGQADVEEWLTL